MKTNDFSYSFKTDIVKWLLKVSLLSFFKSIYVNGSETSGGKGKWNHDITIREIDRQKKVSYIINIKTNIEKSIAYLNYSQTSLCEW